jgi:Zn-dependent protease
MAILLAHEFGHFVAARIHRVDASLPFFLPLPFLSPFGTMGAVIRMRSVIPTRRALLDIGASGPLCGLALAIPLYAWGVAHSSVIALVHDQTDSGHATELGSSLLLSWLDRGFGPVVPQGSDILLSPVAYAAWAGMFVTMINLLPVGQLDGGHVAYAWFGERQVRLSSWVHRSLLVFFFVSLASFVLRDLKSGIGMWQFGQHVSDSLFWLVMFEVLAMLGEWSRGATPNRTGAEPGLSVGTRAVSTVGIVVVASALHSNMSVVLWIAWSIGVALLIAMEMRWGALRRDSQILRHPAAGGESLRGARWVVAAITLGLLALLFMPTPMSS